MSLEKPLLDPTDHQGGKAYGQLMEQQEKKLNDINQEYLDGEQYKDVEDLEVKLNQYKAKFLEFDLDTSGDIDFDSLKKMLEKLGQPRTHLEVKRMISEVDTTNSGTISYREFVLMMLGGKRTILSIILFFESLGKADEPKKGVAPKRALDSLP